MTAIGMFFTIERNGKWDSVDICDMTDGELEELEAQLKDTKNISYGWNIARTLARWIRDNVKEVS